MISSNRALVLRNPFACFPYLMRKGTLDFGCHSPYAGVCGCFRDDSCRFLCFPPRSSWHAQVSHDEGRLANSPSSGPCTRSSGTCCPCVFITRCHSTSLLISPSSCPRKSLHMASTRAVSWPMFSPLSVTKWPSYHTIPSKFASNREILFCANEPQKRENASELGVKT